MENKRNNKIRSEINEIKKKSIEKVNKTTADYLKKPNETDKALGRLIKKKRKKTPITNNQKWKKGYH